MYQLDTDYGYITGLVRSLESKLFTKTHAERMLESSSAEEAYAVLADTDFAESVDEVSVRNFEAALEKSLLYTKETLTHTVPNKRIMSGVWMWYDVYNLKIALKASFQGKTFDDIVSLFSPFGSLNLSVLKAVVFADAFHAELNAVRTKALELATQYNNIQYIDFVCDKFLFESLVSWSQDLDSEILEQFVKTRIDCINAQTFLRLEDSRRQELNDTVFIHGGTKALVFFTGSADEGRAAVQSLFGEDVIELFEQKAMFQPLVQASENALTKLLQSARYIGTGPEPVVAYWWARQKTVEIIRVILGGKMNEMDSSMIRENLKELY